MSRITFHLDEETHALVQQAAKASGMSKSRWVADLVRRHVHGTWPAAAEKLAGAFPDFPLREKASSITDPMRIGF
ncbi:CopG family transcriptional regulator [Orrella sp. JC864]|uniref:CopG family transcriptional regulator n=1 Tax=Orrella sp. JC864 TaxID=3120298 RepID=UPI0030098B67